MTGLGVIEKDRVLYFRDMADNAPLADQAIPPEICSLTDLGLIADDCRGFNQRPRFNQYRAAQLNPVTQQNSAAHDHAGSFQQLIVTVNTQFSLCRVAEFNPEIPTILKRIVIIDNGRG